MMDGDMDNGKSLAEVLFWHLLNGIISLMEGESSWEPHPISHFGSEVAELEPVSGSNNGGEAFVVCLDSILPDDILERILSFLPIASIIRAASVCKRWYDIIHSRRFLWANKLPQKPWYYMFTYSEAPAGYAYDPILRKWYSFNLPCIEKSNWFISSSCGLVCSMDNDSRSRIFVCNPITTDWKMLLEPPGVKFPDYSTLAISVDRKSHDYTIVVAKSKQVPGDFLQWEFSIHIYESGNRSWVTSITEVFTGWRGGDESVICNGVLYCMIHSTAVLGTAERRHGLIMYDLSARSSHTSLMRTLIPVPCSLTCGRMMNLKERLVMVGGIAKYDRPDIIRGIGIWELYKEGWREVTRMPHRFFQGFGEFDDVFASSGTEDLIYIQSYGATALLVFDMSQKQWKWSVRCPVTKRFPLQLFTGFCFEPRLEVAC
ncbi:F-box/kelch-repeat protein At3g61590-like isoform X2 [Phoenix dactylifera]|uniref:F-box/kelch-repeat protein At3g61590-like isoform X2 n=1 Tax=Phoenix dactylifera TaxID=42345 RepID=A0A8B8J5D4_PHODC|nr:F-box/kelch-repeat protein At3g61590-like isoform X2 [Phoenix dactylifera]